MGRRILALVEQTIGTRLLLASQLGMLGYDIAMPFTLTAFKQQLRGERFDWVVLDEEELPTPRQAFVAYVARHRHDARVLWCGGSRPPPGLPIEATFGKPLRHDEITTFFAGVST